MRKRKKRIEIACRMSVLFLLLVSSIHDVACGMHVSISAAAPPALSILETCSFAWFLLLLREKQSRRQRDHVGEEMGTPKQGEGWTRDKWGKAGPEFERSGDHVPPLTPRVPFSPTL